MKGFKQKTLLKYYDFLFLIPFTCLKTNTDPVIEMVIDSSQNVEMITKVIVKGIREPSLFCNLIAFSRKATECDEEPSQCLNCEKPTPSAAVTRVLEGSIR